MVETERRRRDFVVGTAELKPQSQSHRVEIKASRSLRRSRRTCVRGDGRALSSGGRVTELPRQGGKGGAVGARQ